ncbi:MAG TPA: aspartate aminotransferase family protein [Microlunatus sp.]
MTQDTGGSDSDLQEMAKRHLWMHFTRMSAYEDAEVPIITRGEGCYVYDEAGKRYFDGLAALFCVNAGHGRTEIGEAMAEQVKDLGFFTNWSYAHPTAIKLAKRIADLAPGDLNRVFFTSGGSEAVESALKLCRLYHRKHGEAGRFKLIAREIAYHGTTQGALSITGLPALKAVFEPLVPSTFRVPNTNFYRAPEQFQTGNPGDREAFGTWAADQIAVAIEQEGPDTVAAVFLEPVQNAGGCFPPPPGYFARVREICDAYDVLLVSDEVICAFGRLGHMFGAERYGYVPDIITCAKGLTSGYSPLGAMIASDRLMEPFLHGTETFLHGYTFGGHPVSTAVAMANLDVFERDHVNEHVRANEGAFRATLEKLLDLPIVGDVRGDGYFYGIELVKDAETKSTFDADESERLLRGFLSKALYDAGLYCRADDRGDPVIQLSPPLICEQSHFDEMEAALRSVLTEAQQLL